MSWFLKNQKQTEKRSRASRYSVHVYMCAYAYKDSIDGGLSPSN